ncbi:hypothetical protein GCM10027300_12560 [Modestobacter lapidis]
MTGALLRALVLVVVVLLATGCGVQAQDRPEPVVTAAPPSTDASGDSRRDGPRLTLYLVRGADLAPVERPTSRVTAQSALELLVEGPTRAEARDGVRTALAPEVVGVEQQLADGLTTVSVSRGFTGLAGGNQLLAVAQVVWTLTELPTVTTVRFTVGGTLIEVPTDEGLTDRAVARDDYRSVAPIEEAPTGPTATDPAPAGPTATPAPGGATPTGRSPVPDR